MLGAEQIAKPIDIAEQIDDPNDNECDGTPLGSMGAQNLERRMGDPGTAMAAAEQIEKSGWMDNDYYDLDEPRTPWGDMEDDVYFSDSLAPLPPEVNRHKKACDVPIKKDIKAIKAVKLAEEMFLQTKMAKEAKCRRASMLAATAGIVSQSVRLNELQASDDLSSGSTIRHDRPKGAALPSFALVSMPP